MWDLEAQPDLLNMYDLHQKNKIKFKFDEFIKQKYYSLFFILFYRSSDDLSGSPGSPIQRLMQEFMPNAPKRPLSRPKEKKKS